MQQTSLDVACAYCHASLGAAPAPRCPLCSAPHHVHCWEDNVGCAVLGCAAAPEHEQPAAAEVSADPEPTDSLPFLRWPQEDEQEDSPFLADAPEDPVTIRRPRRLAAAAVAVLLLALPVTTALAVRADLLAPVLGHVHSQSALDAAVEQAQEAGYEAGHDAGHESGVSAGKAQGRAAGLVAGRAQGRSEAESDADARAAAEYARGFDAGTAAASQPGSSAYQAAYDAGEQAGRDAALVEGTYDDGFEAGVASTRTEGTYDEGYELGYELGRSSGVSCAVVSSQPSTDCTD